MITANPDTDLYSEVVAALTRAAHQRKSDGTPADFSDFLAHALAATAASVGGPDQLIAGRPGSWESAYVDGLVRGTIGDQPEDWTWFRTQPILIRLNVAELVEDGQHHPGLMGLDEALENVGGRYETAGTEQDLDAWDAEIDAITARYTTEYRHYAERFGQVAHAVAAHIPGLSADVYIEADTDPNSHWWKEAVTNNPTEVDSDHLALQIWQTAHHATPLPNVDIWIGAALPQATKE